MTNKSSNIPYIIAIVVMVSITILAIVAVSIFRPNQDNANIITQIVVVAPAAIFAFLALMKAQETHLSVNSRLDEIISSVRAAATAEGEIAGQKRANERTDELRKQKSVKKGV